MIDSGDYMNRWFYINGILLIAVSWVFFTGSLHKSIAFGYIGFLFFLINWTRHAMFSTIRSNIPRKKKIAFAQFSKRFLPFHKWTGTLTLVFILIHGLYMFDRFTFQLTNGKMLSGLIAALTLTAVVTFGWLRLYWPSTRKRFTHLYLAMALFFLLSIHIFLF
ncbi:MAG TPA: hypothetical protein VK125_02005 [Bacillota bacterium]|nr:hypothetical protein [Bacillota bacterium]